MTATAALCAGCGGPNGESDGDAGQRAANGAAGGSGLLGDYGGDECLYDKLTFANSGLVYLTVFGTDQAGQYRIDGERIVVTAGAQSVVFTKNGRNLEANVLGDRMVCAPLASDGLAEVYEARTDEGRIALELGAGGQARMILTGSPGGDGPQRMTFDVRYEVRGDNVTVEMPGEEPMRFVRDGRDLVATMDGETVRFVRR